MSTGGRPAALKNQFKIQRLNESSVKIMCLVCKDSFIRSRGNNTESTQRRMRALAEESEKPKMKQLQLKDCPRFPKKESELA